MKFPKPTRGDTPSKIRTTNGKRVILNGLFVLFVQLVLATEALHATSRINKLLLAGEERMTVGAYLNIDGLAGRTSFVLGAAGAGNFQLVIFRMNSGFHNLVLYSVFSFSNPINKLGFPAYIGNPS